MIQTSMSTPPPSSRFPQEHEQWPRGSDHLFTCWAFTISLHSLWTLPMVIVRQGGLAFLLIYAILVALLGAPLLLLELALGQYSALPTARYVGNIKSIQNWKTFKISIVSGCIATSAHYCPALALRSQCLHLLEVGILGALCLSACLCF